MAKRCVACDHLVAPEHDENGRCLIDYPWQCSCPGCTVVYDDETGYTADNSSSV